MNLPAPQHDAIIPSLLLVARDDEALSRLAVHLGREGFSVRCAGSLVEALEALGRACPDMVVLDLAAGAELLDRLTEEFSGQTEWVVLSDATDRSELVDLLASGAADCMVKPVSPRELSLRIKKRLDERRPRPSGAYEIETGPIAVDLERHQVRVDGTPVTLTLTEFRLLAAMIRNAGKVRSREALMDEVWSHHGAPSRTIDTHVRRLRSKLGRASGCISTVRGVGYRLACDPIKGCPSL